MSVESLLGRRRTVLFPLCGGRAEDAARRRSWSWRGGCAGGCKGLPSPHQQTPRSPFVSWPRLLPSSSLQDPHLAPCLCAMASCPHAASTKHRSGLACLPACRGTVCTHCTRGTWSSGARATCVARPPRRHCYALPPTPPLLLVGGVYLSRSSVCTVHC